MPNVKLFLTPYKFVANDEVQNFFRTAQHGGDYVLSCFEGIFAQRLQPGLNFLLDPLRRGTENNWWRNVTTDPHELYRAARTVGMYESGREPSLCIDLNLVDQNRAVDLIRIAVQFGSEFDQGSVHVLFSLPDESTQIALLQIQPAGKGRLATSHLATYRNSILPQTILDEAVAAEFDAITIDVSAHQLQYHYKNVESGMEFTKWTNLMNKLAGGNINTWEALLFAIGDGSECTSKYKEWLD